MVTGISLTLPLHYFPSVAWCTAACHATHCQVAKDLIFQKQTFFNRAYIKGPNKTLALSVPLVHASTRGLLRDVRICYEKPWFRLHQTSIRTAYGKTAFFEYYAEDIFRILECRADFLMELNDRLLEKMLHWLKLSSRFQPLSGEKATPLFLDFNKKSFPLGFNPISYFQPFGDFVPNLSCLDLLFNCGPEAIDILRKNLSTPLTEIFRQPE